MKRTAFRLIALALLGVALGAAPSPAPSAPAATSIVSPTPAPDPAILARAQAAFKAVQAGKLDRSLLTPAASAALTPARVDAASAALAPLGAPVTFEQERIVKHGADTVYVYLLAFGNTKTFDFAMALDPSGKIAALQVVPAK